MKDFDFKPELSAGGLIGNVVLPRELADLSIWKQKPFSPASAICDLYLLANTDAGEHRLTGGLLVKYQPGWCLWSNVALAERWGWRRDAVAKFLTTLTKAEIIHQVDLGMSRFAIVLNKFCTADSQQTDSPCSADGQQLAQQAGTVEAENGVTEGECPRNTVPLEQAMEWMLQQAGGYSSEEISAAWNGLTAGAVAGCWVTGRPPRPVADWRAALADELWKRRQLFGQQKNSGARRAEGEAPAPVSNQKLSISDMR